MRGENPLLKTVGNMKDDLKQKLHAEMRLGFFINSLNSQKNDVDTSIGIAIGRILCYNETQRSLAL